MTGVENNWTYLSPCFFSRFVAIKQGVQLPLMDCRSFRQLALQCRDLRCVLLQLPRQIIQELLFKRRIGIELF
jgi:hypothetical protein